MVSSDVYQFQLFRSCVVGASQTRADWKAPSDSGPVLDHSTGAYCSGLGRGHVYSATAFLSITTKETSLLSGLHSAMSLGRLWLLLCRAGCGRGVCFFGFRIWCIFDYRANRLAQPARF